MPMPVDQHVAETSEAIVKTFHEIFGPHPGYRPAHAKGVLLKGHFTPTAEAAKLSTAPHLNQPSTPVLARFSSSTGIPEIPDTDPNGNPRGFALRFELASTPRRVHTDIVSHSTPSFPAPTPDEALAFFRSLVDGSVGAYVAAHPAAQRFLAAPKPTPASFATEQFFGVNAFKLVDAAGTGTFIRYRIVPAAGVQTLTEEEVKAKEPNFLYDGVTALLKEGPIVFHLVAQIAEEGDPTNDATLLWPESRKIVTLGTLKLEALVENDASEQKRIIFDPIPRVQGIEASDDPLLEVRAGVYLVSGKERRAA